MTDSIYFIVFAQGVVGSIHCVFMCGPFCELGSTGKCNNKSYGRFGLYQLGRIGAYIAVGLLIGFGGGILEQWAGSGAAFYLGLAIFAFFGLGYLLKSRRQQSGAGLAGQQGSISGDAWGARLLALNNGKFKPAALGIVSALLPCGLLYSTYGLALSTGTVSGASLVMLIFGVATSPALGLVVFSASKMRKFLTPRIKPYFTGLVFVAASLMFFLRIHGNGVHANHVNHANHAHQAEQADQADHTDHTDHIDYPGLQKPQQEDPANSKPSLQSTATKSALPVYQPSMNPGGSAQ